MAIDTKKVEGRRELQFQSLDDVLADLDQLASGEVKTLGNWSLGQICGHLAAGMSSALDGSSFNPPFIFRLIGPFMKKKFLTGKMPTGFKIPKAAEGQFLPSNDVETEAAVGELRSAIERLKAASDADLVRHPMFGEMTKHEAEQFHLRHAEMHLSFVVPAAS
ncbi:MAG: DUF1569 domain-containing protein [Planctomycetes bacterium]|nr:DUF1569 domain-containing protein [Planctomycetota bacterium]